MGKVKAWAMDHEDHVVDAIEHAGATSVNDVVAYLKGFVEDLPSATSSEGIHFRCGGPDVAHVPPKRYGRDLPRIYCLCKAAEHGCLQCVRHLVKTEGLDPIGRSLTCSYSAGDFARWGLRFRIPRSLVG